MSTDLASVMQWLATQTGNSFAQSLVSQSAYKNLSDKQIACAVKMYNEAMTAASQPVLALVARIEEAVTDPTPEVLAAITAVTPDVNAAVAGDMAASRRAQAALKALLATLTGETEPVDPRAADVAVLSSNMALVASRDHSFVISLVTQYQQRGSLSDKQWSYIVRFAGQVKAVLAEAEALQAAQVVAQAAVQVRDRIIAMTGSDTVSHAIRVCIPSLAGDPTGEPLFFGLVGWGVSNTGVQKHVGAPGDVRSIAMGNDRAIAVIEALLALDDSALTEAQAEYGRQMHYCGRCGSPLTTAASRAIGLGPDCASK